MPLETVKKLLVGTGLFALVYKKFMEWQAQSDYLLPSRGM
jgi:hypothetical protein